MANSVEPDETEPSHLDLHCLLKCTVFFFFCVCVCGGGGGGVVGLHHENIPI